MKSHSKAITGRITFAIIGLGCLLFVSLKFMGCNPEPQQGGRFEQTPNLEYDRNVISPPSIVPHLLTCGKSVTVKGFIKDAKIRIYINGAFVTDEIGRDPDGVTVKVPDLIKDQIVTATQEFEGKESDPSSPETVKDHKDVYPSGLPRPNFPELYLYNCGVATVVDQLPPGGTVRVFSRAPADAPPGAVISSLDGVAMGQSLGVFPPFKETHKVTAESQICSDISTRSEEQTVQQAPGVLPTPQATGIWDGGTMLTVHQLVNGANVTIKRAGTVIAGGGAPSSHVKFFLNTVVNDANVLEITQELCGVVSPVGTVTVQPCSSLPPPKIMAPRDGDQIVYLTDVVAGARIRIFSMGKEIGDGGGSQVTLIRKLVKNETVIVVQSIGNCIAAMVYVVEVGHGLDDPLQGGNCGKIVEFEYGAQNDPQRQMTDVSSYFDLPDWRSPYPMNAVPLHGVVRYPDGPGPFPLVIIVHGNSNPTKASYPGYTYLLDHLASHCMIAVSIEEDFLNGDVEDEMDARAIVLLRHLQVWREWNRTPGHQFYGKVDMASVGLAGHSRGGEAIVAADQFNHSLHNPADPAHNFNFGIRSLFAIAPVDGQFELGEITITGSDYYVMHGSHDGDVSTFDGHRMYDRAFPVNNPANKFKGLLFVYGANHNYWNSAWTSSPDPSITPTANLIAEADQKLIGKSYITSFFLASLKGWTSYRYFLNGEVTFNTLPPGITRIFQYQDPSRIFLNHYEEDDDLNTGSLPGIVNSPQGTFDIYEDYAFVDEGPPHYLWDKTDGLIVGWRNKENTAVRIQIPTTINPSIKAHEFLGFRVAQALEQSPTLNTPGANKDMSVQIVFNGASGPEVKISDYATLPYPLVTGKNPWGFGGPKTVMQTVRIPWKDLIGNLPNDINVNEIILKFNKHNAGKMSIDEVQLTD